MLKQCRTKGKSGRKSLFLYIDENALVLRIEQVPCHLANPMADLKAVFCLLGIIAKLRVMNLQPESFLALAQGHQF